MILAQFCYVLCIEIQVLFNLGGVLGSIITFGTNFDVDNVDAGDGADDLTFEAFLAVMSLGIILIFFLADPATVIRPDGTNANTFIIAIFISPSHS
jgi:hypothetical protein